MTGTLKATAIGNYNASAKPKANYCWNDGTTTKRDYVWSIKSNTMLITLNDKETDYTGSAINIDAPVIKNSDGDVITGPSITYAYYNGGSCSGTALVVLLVMLVVTLLDATAKHLENMLDL